MEEKLSPLRMVAREMSEHCTMSEEQIGGALAGVLDFLAERAREQIDLDVNSSAANEAATQYRVVAEVVAFLGSQLIAFEDIELESRDEFPN